MSDLAWRLVVWITPRWLSKKFQMYMLRGYVERHPAEMDRKIREALAPLLKLEAQQSGATRSEEELAALSKQALDVILQVTTDATAARPYGIRHPQAHKRRFTQSGPHP